MGHQRENDIVQSGANDCLLLFLSLIIQVQRRRKKESKSSAELMNTIFYVKNSFVCPKPSDLELGQSNNTGTEKSGLIQGVDFYTQMHFYLVLFANVASFCPYFFLFRDFLTSQITE